jgi:molybdenum cofactor synthesis domain-containing protein
MAKATSQNSLRVNILVVSDRAASGERADATGPALCEFLKTKNVQTVAVQVVPDEKAQIVNALLQMCPDADLILTAGGTGLAARDVTPEATSQVVERPAPGIAEAMRAAGLRVTPHAMLSRGIAGTRGKTLIINLPGSPKGAVESLAAVWEALPHAVALLRGPVADESHKG